MKVAGKKKIIIIAAGLLLCLWAAPAGAGNTWLDANGVRIDNVTLNGSMVSNSTYWMDPPFLSSKVPPNVLIVLDNSGSMNDQAYASGYDPTQFVSGQYFGYFDSTKCYIYQSQKWDVVGSVDATTRCQAFSGLASTANPVASGNLLNWASMRRIDAAKKLLVGGKANPRSMTTGCCVKLTGENSPSPLWNFSKDYDNSSTTGLIYPFNGDYRYSMSGASLSVISKLTGTDITLRPNADRSVPAGWIVTSPTTSAWDAVAEATADTTTYIQNQTSSGATPVMLGYPGAYPSGSPPAGVITDVTVYVRAKKSASGTMRIRAVVDVAGTNYDSNYSNLSTSYNNYSFGWVQNPKTSAAWTWADLQPGASGNVLQGFGVRAETSPTSGLYPTITQVYIVIHVISPSGGPYGITIDTSGTKISGIVDDLSNDARFGLAYFNNGKGLEAGTINGRDDGGHIDTYIDFGQPTNMITSIGNLVPDTWTPLAETVYEMVRYFRQDAPYYTGNSPADYQVGQNYDPYFYKYSSVAGSGLADMYVPCAKSFILLLTDGESTQDRNIPTAYQDYDGDGRDDGGPGDPVYPSNGSDYLDDVAYWARTQDMRSGPTTTPTVQNLSGTQNIILYSVFMFGKGSQLLMRAAINGGFDDLDGNGVPSCIDPITHRLKVGATQNELKECYRDSNGSGIIEPYDPVTNPTGDLPLTYYQGDDGYELQNSIVEAISAILRRAASGTSVSVLGSSWKGEGSIFQAYFYPEKVEDLRRIKWTGYFQSLFVDRFGLIHEDTNGDHALKSGDDRVVKFIFAPGADTRVEYYMDATGPDGRPDGILDTVTPLATVTIQDTKPLWDAGKLLALRSPSDRTLYTSVDNANLIDFNYAGATDNSKLLRPYLRAKTDAADTSTHSVNATKIIQFIRGEAVTGWRDRQLTVDGTSRTWKLGDVVFSDPLVVPAPKERFDKIYANESYKAFFDHWQNRRAMVYIGSNDGMLHALNGGFSVPAPAETTVTATTAQLTVCEALNTSTSPFSCLSDTSKPLGKELWTFIPYDVLPHLAWLGDPDYMHVYYVDLMTRATDVDIFTPDADHVNGWGTIIIVGMRFGGGEIDVEDDFGSGLQKRAFKSAYYALDVTNPEVPPRLLWRFTDDELGFTLGVPAIVRISGTAGASNWYAVFGSGPSNYRGGRVVDNNNTNVKFTKSGQVAGLGGMSSTNPYLYVIDLATGQPKATWTEHSSVSGSGRKGFIKLSAVETNAFTAGSTPADYPLDFTYDMVYAGTTYCTGTCKSDGSPDPNFGGSWSGNMYRVDLRVASTLVPLTDPGQWRLSKVFSAGRPISTKPSVALDPAAHIWLYFGTGRFLHVDDRFDASAQTFYGFKDSCYATGCTTEMLSTYFLNSGPTYTVLTDGTLSPSISANTLGPLQTSALTSFKGLADFMRDSGTGWKIALPDTRERITVNGFVVAGIAGFGTYTPNNDVCEFEGTSKQWFPYYLTGTSYLPQGGAAVPLYVSTGSGLPSAPAVHIDAQGKARLFIQKSTGEIQVVELPNASPVTGGFGAGGECLQK